LEAELLPDSFNRHFSTPCTLIIDDADPESARVPALAVAPIVATAGIEHRELLPVFHPTETLTMGPFSFDQDTFARQSNLFNVQADGRLVMNGWDLSFRLARQAPIPPPWLREGLCGKYGVMGDNVGGWFVHPYAVATVIGRAQFWLTVKDTERVQSLNQDALNAIDHLRFERIFSGDPAFIAVCGLYAHDVGDDMRARELLEAAVAAGVQRPAAYRALAKLRFVHEAAHPAGPGAKLSATQTEFALEPLVRARRMTPAGIESYGLMAAIWLNSAARPAAADLDFVAEAVSLFPGNVSFAQLAAEIHARFGPDADGQRLVPAG
jgi:hypothetical protein